MNQMTKISVVMSCYNSERFLRQSIDSILAQTFTDFEFIIWNDGSTDNTESIIRSYSDSRIRYFKADNQGLGKALHDACEKVSGKYIVRMDDDDVAYPNRLEVEYEYMEKHPNCVLTSCAVHYINENTESLGYSSPVLTSYAIKKTLQIVHPGVMIRTEAYRKTPGYLNLKTAQDTMLWRFLSPLGSFHNINEYLLHYRIHPNSIGRSQRIAELKKCCYILRGRILHEEKDNYGALINIHNEIYALNVELSKTLPIIDIHMNKNLESARRCLNVLLGEQRAGKSLSLMVTISKYIKSMVCKI